MSACSHTPRKVETRFHDARCLNCRSPFRLLTQLNEWADGYHKFISPSVAAKAAAERAARAAELEKSTDGDDDFFLPLHIAELLSA